MNVPRRVRRICIWSLCLLLAFFAMDYVQRIAEQAIRADAREIHSLEELGSEHSYGETNQFIRQDEVAWRDTSLGAREEESIFAEIFGLDVPQLADQQGDVCILIPKRGGTAAVTERMIYRRIYVKLSTGSLSKEDIIRRSDTKLYAGEPQHMVAEQDGQQSTPREWVPKQGSDPVYAMSIAETESGTELVLEMNTVYEMNVTEDEEYVYLSLVRPRDRYDKIVVIDAGHGGRDPGTSGGGRTEASVNLAIVRYVSKLLDSKQNIKAYYTRLDDTLPDLTARVEFANALQADMLISVHCNYNPVSYVKGVEVLYSSLPTAKGGLTSKLLAEICLNHVTWGTPLRKNTLVDRSGDLHLMKYCKMPAVIIEFGFMSNRGDLSYILTEEAQQMCAEAIGEAIERAIEKQDAEVSTNVTK